MKITILYLYYDLLNLYGESGNVKVLKKSLESLDIDVSLKFSTLDDEIDLTDVDLIYVGSGSEKNQLLALEHLKKYKEEMKEFILSGKFVLATGNAIEVFSYSAKTSDKRIVDEALYKTVLISSYILGFNNRNSFIVNNQHPFFQSIKGAGNNQNDVNEGYNEYHFYGTYLLGPLLARNPEFLRYFIKELIKFKDPNFTIKKIPLNLEENAYQEFLKNYYSEYIS